MRACCARVPSVLRQAGYPTGLEGALLALSGFLPTLEKCGKAVDILLSPEEINFIQTTVHTDGAVCACARFNTVRSWTAQGVPRHFTEPGASRAQARKQAQQVLAGRAGQAQNLLAWSPNLARRMLSSSRKMTASS